jgi:hypothetical protein
MLLVDLVVKRPEHSATFSAHLLLEPLVQGSRQMTDTTVSWSYGRCPPVEDAKDQNPGGESATHAAGRRSLHSFFVDIDRPSSSMKPGGHLRGSRFQLKFQHLCDRREDGFASVVSLLSIFIGQPACPLGKDRDPAGCNNTSGRWTLFQFFHFSISSS